MGPMVEETISSKAGGDLLDLREIVEAFFSNLGSEFWSIDGAVSGSGEGDFELGILIESVNLVEVLRVAFSRHLTFTASLMTPFPPPPFKFKEILVKTYLYFDCILIIYVLYFV